MASLTYNLKKYLKFIVKKPTRNVQEMVQNTKKIATNLKTYFNGLKRVILGYTIFRKLTLVQN